MGNTSRADAYVSNMYWRVLNRAPEAGGWNFWTGEMSPCNATNAAWVGENFLVAPEFLDDLPMVWVNETIVNERIKARVRMAYRVALGREPDPSGFAFWTEQLDNAVGESARETIWATIYDSFTVSPEFNDRVNGNLGANIVDGGICS